MEDRERQLREKAYQLWQQEGEPHGRDREHWQQAELDLPPADAPAAEDAVTADEAETVTGVARAPEDATSAPAPAETAPASPIRKAAKPRTPRGKSKPANR